MIKFKPLSTNVNGAGFKAELIERCRFSGGIIPESYIIDFFSTKKIVENFNIISHIEDKSKDWKIEITLEIQKLIDPDSIPSFLIKRKGIVRDSPIMDWKYAPAISGLFESVNSVNSKTVSYAIITVLESFVKNMNDPLIMLLGDKKPKGMAILVQEEIIPSVSGILHTRSQTDKAMMEISFVKGHLSKIVNGEISGHRLLIPREVNLFDFPSVLGEEEDVEVAEKTQLVDKINLIKELGLYCEKVIDTDAEIEWGIANGVLWLLQVQPQMLEGQL